MVERTWHGGRGPLYRSAVSTALTAGIRVQVRTEFRADRSQPAAGRWLFSYTIRISNEGEGAAKLVSRHWIITDANGDREEVVGDGVVGQQPLLATGESFEYTSFCVLKTPHGSMRGTYHMAREDGRRFDADIAPFSLVAPGSLN
jgi:ApaG protein